MSPAEKSKAWKLLPMEPLSTIEGGNTTGYYELYILSYYMERILIKM